MSSDTLSSTTSSSPTPFDDPDDLTRDLQPAPLRLPQRKFDDAFDGSNSIDQEQVFPEGVGASTSTIRRDSPSPPLRATLVKALSQRRPPAPKLGTLVSKFEILDALNNVETSSSSEVKARAIPQAQGPLRRKGGPVQAMQQIAAAEGHDDAGHSSDISPRQIASPPPRVNKSKLPVSTLSKATTREDYIRTGFRHHGRKGNDSSEGIERHLESQVVSTSELAGDNDGQATSHNTTSQTSKPPG
ncbi:hypothetical protein F5Y05DRAFT_115937 [Hypoxylon sp. FL0543]|nr:hypothetical protein F5Y05DRAFT_115937 [Hypoxylon sp. FL0543]